MLEIDEVARRLNVMLIEALDQYNAEMASGGEPVYPEWAGDLAKLLESHEHARRTVATVQGMLDNVV